jgi:hypothetical protein
VVTIGEESTHMDYPLHCGYCDGQILDENGEGSFEGTGPSPRGTAHLACIPRKKVAWRVELLIEVPENELHPLAWAWSDLLHCHPDDVTIFDVTPVGDSPMEAP